MASQLEIFNMALSRIGIAQRILALDEKTEPRRQCSAWWDHCRDECLRAHPWGFARRSVALAAAANQTFPGYTQVYDYPIDCLRALAVVPEEGLRYPWNWLDLYCGRELPGAPRVPFDRIAHSGKEKQLIVCDLEEAHLLYIARITATTVYDSGFISMLAWGLASEIGTPLKAKASLVDRAAQYFEGMRTRAMALDLNESEADPEGDSASIQVRS